MNTLKKQSSNLAKEAEAISKQENRAVWFRVIAFTIIQVCWFSPIASARQMQNAFALPYIGVNSYTYYMNLAMIAAFTLPLMNRVIKMNKKSESQSDILLSILIAFAGSIIRIGGCGGYNGTYEVFIVGQALIGFANVIAMLSVLKPHYYSGSS